MLDNQPQLVTKANHANKEWLRPANYQFASKLAVVPIGSAEIAHCAHLFPIAFVSHSGRQELVVRLSLSAGQNLFVAPNGRWIGSYIPALIRGYPFRLIQTNDQKLLLGVDEASGLVQEAGSSDGGSRFYDDEGKPTDSTQKIVDFLTLTHRSTEHARKAASMLAESGLLDPWSMPLERKDQQEAGLSKVNESRLNSISGKSWSGCAMRELWRSPTPSCYQ